MRLKLFAGALLVAVMALEGIGFSSTVKDNQPTETKESAQEMVRIDLKRTDGRISPLLFGHNLEHARRATWQGLIAEAVDNPKFAGEPSRAGVVYPWFPVGINDAEFIPDRQVYYSKPQSQSIRCQKDGARCGIAQKCFCLRGGKDYLINIRLRADREMTCQISVRGQVNYARDQKLSAGEWVKVTDSFHVPVDDPVVVVEISFVGVGTLWVDSCSIMPSDNFYGMRRDVVDLLKEISVPLLRWPGGNFSGEYQWKDGLLPVDQRPPVRTDWPETLPFSDGYDFHEIGTNEFMELCRYLGSEPCIAINMALPPEDAAAWVEYCNGSKDTKWGRVRAENGYEEPFNVKYWAVGNEIWGYWMLRSHCDAATYIKRANVYAKAMKAVDPSIVLMSCGSHLPAADWDKTVIANTEADMELLSVHQYVPEITRFEGDDGNAQFESLAKTPSVITLKTLKDANDLIKANTPKGQKIGLSFDEWNMWHECFVRPFLSRELHTGVADAIYAASMLNMFCRESKGLDLRVGAFYEPVNEGAIQVDPYSAKLTALGKVFAAYKVHQNAQLLAIDDISPDADIDSLASLNQDKTQLAITFVNRSATKDIATKVEVRGLTKNSGEVQVTTLSSNGFAPESDFIETQSVAVLSQDNTFTVTVPKHGLAIVRAGVN